MEKETKNTEQKKQDGSAAQDSKNKSANDAKQSEKEKWLYGLAGAGIGSLLTYLFIDHQHKRERKQTLSGIDEEKKEQRIEKFSLK